MAVTLKNTSPLIVPPAIQRRAGLVKAAQLEFRADGGVIIITAKPPAAEEYTPAQRRAIKAHLADARRGPTYGPFTAAEAAKFLRSTWKAQVKKTLKRK